MGLHLKYEITKLQKMILQQGTLVEQGVKQALVLLNEPNSYLAQNVIEADAEIDQKEVNLEEECLKILALHQPVAFDLRYVVTCLKINNDLERIGDLAASICKCTIEKDKSQLLCRQTINLKPLGDLAKEMLRLSLNSLVEMDIGIARNILIHEKNAIIISNGIKDVLIDEIKANPHNIDFYLTLMTISRYIKRIANYAAQIAEDIIYMITGEIVRHQKV